MATLLGASVFALVGNGVCGGNTLDLNLAVAPEIAPAINGIATTFNDAKHVVDGRCVTVVVQASEPTTTRTVLSGQGSAPGEIRPDVWIPDSSLWVTLVRSSPGGADSVRLTPTTIAQTPLVVAASRSLAAKIRNQHTNPTWDMLLGATDAQAGNTMTVNAMLPGDPLQLEILDPTRDAAGLSAVLLMRRLLLGANASARFTQMVRSVQNSVSSDTRSLFATFEHQSRGREPMVIAPEQAVWRYNRGHPAEPAIAIYPDDGLPTMDYPFVTATDNNSKLLAADLLERELSTENARRGIRSLGFRTSEGMPGENFNAASGVSSRIPRALPPPRSTDVTDTVEAWERLSLGTRMLTLLDVSDSMSSPVAPHVTRLEATAREVQHDIGSLRDNSDLGLWTFSTHLQGTQPYRVEVPMGSLTTRIGSGTRRQAILDALGRARPKPNGYAGLYDSVLAAVRSLRKEYRPDMYNSVLVISNGHNNYEGGVTFRELLSTLKKEFDPSRPVTVFLIGLGPDADLACLEKIAANTGGAAYVARQPQDFRKFFLESFARRICSSNCSTG